MSNPKQPLSDYFRANVPPQQKTDLKLAGGGYGEGPFFYSLGTQSTCPFISLEGGGLTQKIFTWGEMIQVDEGQQVTVKSETYHQGDIEIVGGHDYANQPQRITVPVQTTFTGGPAGGVVPLWPADTRRCRKAYLHFQMITAALPGGGVTTIFTGIADKHSFNTRQDGGLPNRYATTIISGAASLVGQLPMGFGFGLVPNSPMALTDKTTFQIIFGADPPAISGVFMYSMEY